MQASRPWRSNRVSPILPDVDEEVRQPEPQPNKDPNAEAPVYGNNERQPSPQPPDDGAAANIAGKEADNNERQRDARPLMQIN